MATLMQWVHVMAAVVSVGGIAFLLLFLIPSLRVLDVEHRDALFRAVAGRFRWASWSAIFLLLISGLFNIRRFYWEEPWDKAWKFLALKVSLSFALFAIILALTIPLKVFDRLRARRRTWLIVALSLGVVVILLSAYLRRG